MKYLQGLKQKQIISNVLMTMRFFVIGLALFVLPTNVLALTDEENLIILNQQVQEAKNKLNQTASQRKSLQGEVAYFNGQIFYAERQIAATNAEITKLNTEMADTEERIKGAEAKLQKAHIQLGEIMRTMYEEGQVSNIELIAKSNSFSEFVDRSEYIEVVQLKIKTIADEVIALKKELDAKKLALQESKKKQEELKEQQLAQRSEIAAQRSIKDRLLADTKGDEAAYQVLVKNLQSQYNTLQNQIWGGAGNYVSLGHVNSGDIIGYIGNSGYSTGSHLHFEVRDGNKNVLNPQSYIGGGYFLDPAPSVPINVRYGRTSDYFWCSDENNWCFHSGIDKADGGRGTPVRSSAEGEIIVRVTGRPNTYKWSVEYGNYVMIKHTNGMYTLYGHLR